MAWTIHHCGGSFLSYIVILAIGASGQGEKDIPFDDPVWRSMPVFEDIALGLHKQAIVYPDEFRLSDEGVGCLSPTHTSNQGDCGTCWAHSSIHAMETEVKRQLVEVDDLPPSRFNINLSERQLIDHYTDEFDAHCGDPDGGENTVYAVSRMARKGWIIPLEGDNCYVQNNARLSDCAFGGPVDVHTGISLGNTAGYEVAFIGPRQLSDREEVAQIKYVLYVRHTAVIVSIYSPGNYDYLDQSTEEGTNHSVCIIGWNNDATVADLDGSQWVEKSIGPAWVVRNSHGNTHYNVDSGRNENWFYLKIGPGIANKKRFFCISSAIAFHQKEEFINRLFDATDLDCDNDELSNVGWCGEVVTSTWQTEIVSTRQGSGAMETDNQKVVFSAPFSVQDPATGHPFTLASGVYIADRYRVQFYHTFQGTELAVYPPKTKGYSAENPNLSNTWGAIDRVVESETVTGQAWLHTFVYFVENLVDGSSIKKWAPCPPDKAVVGVSLRGWLRYPCSNPYAPTHASRLQMLYAWKKMVERRAPCMQK